MSEEITTTDQQLEIAVKCIEEVSAGHLDDEDHADFAERVMSEAYRALQEIKKLKRNQS